MTSTFLACTLPPDMCAMLVSCSKTLTTVSRGGAFMNESVRCFPRLICDTSPAPTGPHALKATRGARRANAAGMQPLPARARTHARSHTHTSIHNHAPTYIHKNARIHARTQVAGDGNVRLDLLQRPPRRLGYGLHQDAFADAWQCIKGTTTWVRAGHAMMTPTHVGGWAVPSSRPS